VTVSLYNGNCFDVFSKQGELKPCPLCVLWGEPAENHMCMCCDTCRKSCELSTEELYNA